ncbi:hypothetical protein [Pseudomonas sp. Marseille-QA0892]
MAVTLKQLYGEDIPVNRQAEGLDVLFEVVAPDGERYFFEAEEEAAAKVVELSDEERR